MSASLRVRVLSVGLTWNQPPAALLEVLAPLVAKFPVTLGLACHHLVTGERWAWGDAPRPAASLIKVHLAVAAYQAVERGELCLQERVSVPTLPEDDEAEFDDLGAAPAGKRFAWRKVIDRMITESDNAATNTLIDRLGLGAIATLTERLNLSDTVLRRRMLDADAREQGRENFTTAAEMATLLAALYQGELLNADHTQELLGLLTQQRHDEKLATGLPPFAAFAHKTGELSGFRHDAGVLAGEWPWVVAALTEGGEPAEADALLARVSAVLYAHFEAARTQFHQAETWLAAERARLIPDERMGHDDLAFSWDAGQLTLTGVTTFAERLSAECPVPLRVTAEHLTGRPGVVTVSCLQLRRGEGHSRELVSQLRMGDPVTVLSTGPDWHLLHGADGYIAYGKSNNTVLDLTFEATHCLAEPLVTALSDDGQLFQLSAGSLVAATHAPDQWRLPGGEHVIVKPNHLYPIGRKGSIEEVLGFAVRFLGLPYLWGGTTGWGLDCSGLVQLVYAVHGVSLPRDADQQQAQTEAVATVAALEPGDLVFFPGHVGLYLGEGQYIHASAKAGMVTINSFIETSPRFEASLLRTFSGGGRSPLRACVGCLTISS